MVFHGSLSIDLVNCSYWKTQNYTWITVGTLLQPGTRSCRNFMRSLIFSRRTWRDPKAYNVTWSVLSICQLWRTRFQKNGHRDNHKTDAKRRPSIAHHAKPWKTRSEWGWIKGVFHVEEIDKTWKIFLQLSRSKREKRWVLQCFYWRDRYHYYYPFCEAMAVSGLTPSSSHMDIVLLGMTSWRLRGPIVSRRLQGAWFSWVIARTVFCLEVITIVSLPTFEPLCCWLPGAFRQLQCNWFRVKRSLMISTNFV